MDPIQLRLNRVALLPDETIDLLHGALLVSELYHPGLDVEPYLRHLDALALDAESAVPREAPLMDRLAAFNRFLFVDQGFSGNREDYYDPRNSFIDQVLDRRLGIPISLSVVYLELARRIGIPAFGVGFPGHFLVRVGIGPSVVLLDPFASGVSVDEDELDRRLVDVFGEEGLVSVRSHPGLLRVASKREIMVRLLSNLKVIFARQEQLDEVLIAVNGILTLIPDSAENLRERGLIYRQIGYASAALADLRRYVSISGNAEDVAALGPVIDELSSHGMRLH